MGLFEKFAGATATAVPEKKPEPLPQGIRFYDPVSGFAWYTNGHGYVESPQCPNALTEAEAIDKGFVRQDEAGAEQEWEVDPAQVPDYEPAAHYKRIVDMADRAGIPEAEIAKRYNDLLKGTNVGNPREVQSALSRLDQIVHELVKSMEPPSPSPDAPAGGSVAPAGGGPSPANLIAAADKGLPTDEETGEVELPAMLKQLGWTSIPTKPTRGQAGLVGKIIATYRMQAENMRSLVEREIASLEKSATAWEQMFGPMLDKYFEENQKRIQSGPNAGKYVNKSMILSEFNCVLSYRASGGWEVFDRRELVNWAKQQPRANWENLGISEEIKVSATTLTPLVKTGAIKPPPGYKQSPVNELAERKVSWK